VNPSVLKIIDLKQNELFIPQYVELRNHYVDLLLTNSVTVDETKEWLGREDVEIRCLIEDNVLTGAAILYLNKKGEVAFFVRNTHRGIGSQLLKVIEEVAKEKKLNSLWAWVMSSNMAAQKTFIKNGYLLEGETEKKYRDKVFPGFVFRKKIVIGVLNHG
jgi:predicted acetyltransferase